MNEILSPRKSKTEERIMSTDCGLALELLNVAYHQRHNKIDFKIIISCHCQPSRGPCKCRGLHYYFSTLTDATHRIFFFKNCDVIPSNMTLWGHHHRSLQPIRVNEAVQDCEDEFCENKDGWKWQQEKHRKSEYVLKECQKIPTRGIYIATLSRNEHEIS